MKVKVPKKIVIKKSPGKGRGAFATRRIKKGEIVETAPVVLYEQIRVEKAKKWSSAEIVMQQYHNWSEWGGEDSPLTCMVLGYGAMYNHSAEPNIVAQRNFEDLTLSFVALKKIKRGEELCHYYPDWVFGYQSREENE